jgi:hypothetical protein
MGRDSLSLVLLLAGLSLALAAEPFHADTPLDVLLGRNQRARFADEVQKRSVEGKTYSWDQYVAWGQELVLTGEVKSPPAGATSLGPMSKHYRCVHCHNLQREDLILTRQDPDFREKMIRRLKPAQPELRDGKVLSMTPGTTLWSAVNRDSFYNGYYEHYRTLRIGDGNVMDRRKLSDAIEVCCYYCSAGRYPAGWERDSILAYLWTLELRFRDLDIPTEEGTRLLKQLQAADAATAAQARDELRTRYLRASAATRCELPQRTDQDTIFYGNPHRATITGDPRAGKLLYLSACAGCHGSDVWASSGKELVESDKDFHEYVWHGKTHPGKPKLYMPLFTTERLTRPQAADIRAYLRSLSR